jgi:hypothetical protein
LNRYKIQQRELAFGENKEEEQNRSRDFVLKFNRGNQRKPLDDAGLVTSFKSFRSNPES